MVLPIADIIFAHTPQDAQQLGTALLHPDGYDWFMENYISIYYNRNYHLRAWEGFTVARSFGVCPFIIHNNISKKNLFAINSNIIEVLSKLLGQGNYITLLINMFYIRNYMNHYHQVRHPHHIFLTGYDRDRHIFIAADFFRTKMTYEECDAEELRTAITNCELDQLDAYDTSMDYFVLQEYMHNIEFFTINSDIRFEFSPKRLMAQLCHFGDSQAPYDISYLPYGFDVNEYYWGFSIYQAIAHDISTNFSQTGYLKRPMYMLNMHHRIMQKRLVYLLNKNLLKSSSELVQMNELLCKKSQLLLNIAIKHEITRGKSSILTREAKILDFIRLLQDEEQLHKTFNMQLLDNLIIH